MTSESPNAAVVWPAGHSAPLPRLAKRGDLGDRPGAPRDLGGFARSSRRRGTGAEREGKPGARGPKTAAGKARSARNALKHGLRSHVLVLLDDEDAADFAAFEAAVRAELAPAGALEAHLAARIVAAAWRARRADRLEAALLGRYLADARPGDAGAAQAALGFGLVRDGNGPRALETLVRYRGGVLAELFRSLAALERCAPRAGRSRAPRRRSSNCPARKPNEFEKVCQNKDFSREGANRRPEASSCNFPRPASHILPSVANTKLHSVAKTKRTRKITPER
jgi:hypothetical protein